MIEKIILDYLNTELNVPCYMEIPEEKPNSFVIIQKTGSGVENFIYSSIFAFQSYAQSLFEAATLNEAVKLAMDNAPAELASVSRSKLNSDYNFTDTTTKEYRYQAVYDIVHY